MDTTKHPKDEKSEKEMEEITVEELNEGLRALVIIEYFRTEFGEIPHPLRIFACRRWMREFKAFQKGFELGQKYVQRMMERREENE